MAPARRRGLTLLELVVVVAILAVLVGLLLPAVQAVRRAALRIRVCNQLRQVSLAAHNGLAATDGRFPNFGLKPPTPDRSAFGFLLPYLEAGNGVTDTDAVVSFVPAYRSPADPSYAAYPNPYREYPIPAGNTSFAANGLLFRPGATMDTVRDGASQTVALCERYARCGPKVDVNWETPEGRCELAWLSGSTLVTQPTTCERSGCTPATFSHPNYYPSPHSNLLYNDVHPVRTGGGTDASVAGKSFQVAPAPQDCDPTVPQASFTAGLIVAMMDGSVRVVGRSVTPAAFWSAVTPDWGDIAGDW